MLPEPLQRLGVPSSLKNIKYTRMHHLKIKFFPQRGPARMFPRHRCGSQWACLRHSHKFTSVVIPVTRIVHVQLQQ